MGVFRTSDLIDGVTCREESDEQTGYKEKVIIETRDKTKNPTLQIVNENDEEIRSYNLPVGGHLSVEDGQMVKSGEVLVKIPRASEKPGTSQVAFHGSLNFLKP